MTDGRLYVFTGPAFAIIMAGAFLLAWLYQRQYRYALCFAAGFFLYAIAALMQVLGVPNKVGLNGMLTAPLYAACIFLLSKGVLLHAGLKGGDGVYYLISALVVFLVWYFFYVEQSLFVRIYVQNLGFGLMILMTAVRLGMRHSRRTMDRVLFWAVLLFGLHFFIRMVMTLPVANDLNRIEQLGSEGADFTVLSSMFNSSMFGQVLHFTILIFGFILALAFLAAVVVDIIDDLRHEIAIDTLTGLANRRGFDTRARHLMKTWKGQPFSLVYCDLDHFKQVNDTYGHAAGDRVLQRFGRVLENELRRSDVAARFGGEEFVMLLAGSRLEQAGLIAERLRARLIALRVEGLEDHVVTASFGVVEVGSQETLDEAIHRADQMAYQAKNSGRDRVCLDPSIRALSTTAAA